MISFTAFILIQSDLQGKSIPISPGNQSELLARDLGSI
jgi:hypothetical protein